MSDPAPIVEARDRIKAGRYDVAVSRLLASIPDLPVEFHRKAYTYTGIAHYFAECWARPARAAATSLLHELPCDGRELLGVCAELKSRWASFPAAD